VRGYEKQLIEESYFQKVYLVGKKNSFVKLRLNFLGKLYILVGDLSYGMLRLRGCDRSDCMDACNLCCTRLLRISLSARLPSPKLPTAPYHALAAPGDMAEPIAISLSAKLAVALFRSAAYSFPNESRDMTRQGHDLSTARRDTT